MTLVKLGLVGAGAIARAYGAAIAASDSAELVAIADVDRAAAEALAAETGATAYGVASGSCGHARAVTR